MHVHTQAYLKSTYSYIWKIIFYYKVMFSDAVNYLVCLEFKITDKQSIHTALQRIHHYMIKEEDK